MKFKTFKANNAMQQCLDRVAEGKMMKFKTFKANAEKFRVDIQNRINISDFAVGDLVEYKSEFRLGSRIGIYQGVVVSIGPSEEKDERGYLCSLQIGIKFINAPRKKICYFSWDQGKELQRLRAFKTDGKVIENSLVWGENPTLSRK
jgi:hypothetical protein